MKESMISERYVKKWNNTITKDEKDVNARLEERKIRKSGRKSRIIL